MNKTGSQGRNRKGYTKKKTQFIPINEGVKLSITRELRDLVRRSRSMKYRGDFYMLLIALQDLKVKYEKSEGMCIYYDSNYKTE